MLVWKKLFFRTRERVYENALSSLRRDGTRVGNKVSLLPSIDFELASLHDHRRTRNKRRRFGSPDPLVTQSNKMLTLTSSVGKRKVEWNRDQLTPFSAPSGIFQIV